MPLLHDHLKGIFYGRFVLLEAWPLISSLHQVLPHPDLAHLPNINNISS